MLPSFLVFLTFYFLSIFISVSFSLSLSPSLSLSLYIYIYVVNSISFQTFFVQAFRIVVDSGRLYQGLRFHTQRKDGTNPTSIRPTKRNRSSNNNSLQKHKSKSTFTGWRHRILRQCSRSTTRGHASPIPLYHLSRLRA